MARGGGVAAGDARCAGGVCVTMTFGKGGNVATSCTSGGGLDSILRNAVTSSSSSSTRSAMLSTSEKRIAPDVALEEALLGLAAVPTTSPSFSDNSTSITPNRPHSAAS
jgi:hypothetical protein